MMLSRAHLSVDRRWLFYLSNCPRKDFKSMGARNDTTFRIKVNVTISEWRPQIKEKKNIGNSHYYHYLLYHSLDE